MSLTYALHALKKFRLLFSEHRMINCVGVLAFSLAQQEENIHRKWCHIQCGMTPVHSSWLLTVIPYDLHLQYLNTFIKTASFAIWPRNWQILHSLFSTGNLNLDFRGSTATAMAFVLLLIFINGLRINDDPLIKSTWVETKCANSIFKCHNLSLNC